MHLPARFEVLISFPFIASMAFFTTMVNCIMLVQGNPNWDLWRLERKFNLFWESRL
jgi:hypothetical protein